MWLEKIREMKKKSGLTTKQIAEQSNIPEPTLEKLFAGSTKDPKLETMRQLVHFFGYALDDLDDKKNSSSTTEAVPEECDVELIEYLRKGLISLGFIKDGEDITDSQRAILLAACQIIKATFSDSK